jgi:ribonuclease HII
VDEVGRGALSGPVTVGVVSLTLNSPSAPTGVKDSKLLAPHTRLSLVPKIRRWADEYAVGHASAEEIDAIGILPALRLAGMRALATLEQPADLVLLDGNHNWFASVPKQDTLFASGPEAPDISVPPVITKIKADMTCAAVACASVLAKVERDGIMKTLALEHPGYGWECNKGYSSPDHFDALRTLGPSNQHRRSWNLPGRDEWEAVG